MILGRENSKKTALFHNRAVYTNYNLIIMSVKIYAYILNVAKLQIYFEMQLPCT